MKFGQLIEYNKKICRKLHKEISSRPLFVFYKNFIWSKRKWSKAYFQYISIALNSAYNKNKLYKALGYWSRDLLNFDILENVRGIVE